MIWRMLSGVPVGSSPPPVRGLYPDWDNFIVWVRWRLVIHTAGFPDDDSGWSDWMHLSDYANPATTLAFHSATSHITATLEIETGGRNMPWQVVYEEVTTVLATGGTTTAITTHDIAVGVVTTLNWDCSIGTQLTGNNAMVLIPAEGV